MKSYIVSVNGVGRVPRPKFGQFLWLPKYSRYVWRGSVISSIEELAKLFVEAAGFLRSQRNYYLELACVEVPAEEVQKSKSSPAAVVVASKVEPEPEPPVAVEPPVEPEPEPPAPPKKKLGAALKKKK